MPRTLLLLLLLAACDERGEIVLPDETGLVLVDVDGDGSPSIYDCDDNNPLSLPGAPELCDGVDNNCNEVVDDEPVNAVRWYADVDSDNYGDPNDVDIVCHKEPVLNRVLNDLDCDDENPDRNPGASEECDGLDNDCNGLVDEDMPANSPTFYLDWDQDGYGDPLSSRQACVAPTPDHVEDGTDCNDLNADVNPGAKERCDTLWDDDCDFDPNNKNSIGCTTWYLDQDEDGYGVDTTACLCRPASKYAATNTDDCDDAAPSAHPGGTEQCGDDIDQDCDGADRFCEVLLGVDYDTRMRGEGWADTAGNSVAGVGDVNQDGVPDVMVGAPHNSSTWSATLGEAYILFGPFTSGATRDLVTAEVNIQGLTSDDWFGAKVAAAGDVNGDDIPDVLVGAPGDTTSRKGAGSAYLFLGPITGDLWASTGAYASYTGQWADDGAGSGIAGLGDVDDDGFGDFAISAPVHGTPPESGAVYLLFGPQEGKIALSDVLDRVMGVELQERLGWSIDSAGDRDGDGLPDLVMGAPGNDEKGVDAGAAYVALSPWSGTVLADQTDAMLTGEADGDNAGFAVAGLGDVDDDGLDDYAVGAPYESTNGDKGGVVYVITDPVVESRSLKRADTTLYSETDHQHVGTSIDGVADFDGDGSRDVLIGAPEASWKTVRNTGVAFLWYGPLAAGSFNLSEADLKISGEFKNARFAQAVADAGDVNADGKTDVILGAPKDDQATTDAGMAYVFFGR